MNGIVLARPSEVIAYGSTGWHFHARTGMYLMNDIQFSKIHVAAGGEAPPIERKDVLGIVTEDLFQF